MFSYSLGHKYLRAQIQILAFLLLEIVKGYGKITYFMPLVKGKNELNHSPYNLQTWWNMQIHPLSHNLYFLWHLCALHTVYLRMQYKHFPKLTFGVYIWQSDVSLEGQNKRPCKIYVLL